MSGDVPVDASEQARYDYDLFVSYARVDKDEVSQVVKDLKGARLKVWWDDALMAGDLYPAVIRDALAKSRHFLVYCTAHSRLSPEVKEELARHRELAEDDPSRKLFLLCKDDFEPRYLPEGTEQLQTAQSVQEVIVEVLGFSREALLSRIDGLQTAFESETKKLREALAAEQKRVAEARTYFGNRRFWGPFAENRDLHVFTCGRDSWRERGARTNIDKWDYRAVVELAHFFVANYQGTKLTIEDPASKLQQDDIGTVNVVANRIAEVRGLLENKDCIIIGSPDVSDFAEVVLSSIHGLNPYDKSRGKSRGFVLMRDEKTTDSAFFWKTEGSEREGIARLGDPPHIYYHEAPDPLEGPDSVGTMHGLLVVAENPFSVPPNRNMIMILAGFSGVATNAMTRFLTGHEYRDSFFELDEEYAQHGPSAEALIEVRYTVQHGFESMDTREVVDGPDAVRFVELISV